MSYSSWLNNISGCITYLAYNILWARKAKALKQTMTCSNDKDENIIFGTCCFLNALRRVLASEEMISGAGRAHLEDAVCREVNTMTSRFCFTAVF